MQTEDIVVGSTVLVTGGTGFVGRALCQALLQAGAQVVVLSRSKRPAGDHGAKALRQVSSLQELKGESFDTVINLAGEPISQRWTPQSKARILSSHIGSTQALIQFMQQAPRPPRVFISASAIGFYGTSVCTVFDEQTPPSTEGGAFSHELCALWEQEAVCAEALGVRTVRLRLGVVLGPGGGFLQKMLLPFKLGLGARIGHGRQWLSWIERDDLIQLILHVVRTPTLNGPVNATAPKPVPQAEFCAALARALHRPCLFTIPPVVLRVALGDMAEELMLQGQQVVPSQALASGFVFEQPEIQGSLQKILG